MKSIEDALDECVSLENLKRLDSGQVSLKDLLAPYPEYEAELRPLVKLALSLHRLLKDTDFRERIKRSER